MKKFNAILQLRRDNDYNYAKIADKFIPAKGEVCLVDTARDGLQAVIGDGKSYFKDLTYAFSFIERGYFNNNKFYSDAQFTTEIIGSELKLYIDNKGGIYYFAEENFVPINGTVTAASPQTAGIMKLYSTIGSNEDGTMTQKAITDELDDKVEVALNIDEELLIFTT